MGSLFLTPLALAAVALIAVPWYLHHVRRPERDDVPFSSLMFVPVVKKEIIERRRLQHLLLMLLRMAVILALATSFARPYVPAVAEQKTHEEAQTHVILLDTSYSMAANDAMAKGKAEVLKILDSMRHGERVALMAFDESPRVVAPLGDANVVRSALDSIETSYGVTRFGPALRHAADMLLTDRESTVTSSVVHLVSDLQRQGMSDGVSSWRMPSFVNVQLHPVGGLAVNHTVADLVLSAPEENRLQIRARIKNGSREEDAILAASLVIEGQARETKSVDVAAGHASQVVFTLPVPTEGALTGWIEIPEDALNIDNRRYFAWSTPMKQRIVVVERTPSSTRWPASRLLAHALPERPDAPWSVRVVKAVTPEALSSCDVLVVTDSTSLEDANPDVVDFVQNGGDALLCLGNADSSSTTENPLLAALGFTLSGLRFAEVRDTRFALLSWIDFDHPVFQPFTGARYNDFSDVRFYNHSVIEFRENVPGVECRVVAKFEGAQGTREGYPAMVDVRLGKGRVAVWAFPIDLSWSTLPRSPRFLPVLHETLAMFADGFRSHKALQVGDVIEPPRKGVAPRMLSTKGTLSPYGTRFEMPGHVEWIDEASEELVWLDAVNVDPREGDLARLTPEEFSLRFAAYPVNDASSAHGGPGAEAPRTPFEYGRYLIALVLVLLVLETWYAARLASHSRKPNALAEPSIGST